MVCVGVFDSREFNGVEERRLTSEFLQSKPLAGRGRASDVFETLATVLQRHMSLRQVQNMLKLAEPAARERQSRISQFWILEVQTSRERGP